MTKSSATIAVFDLDGTITTKDTYLEFIKYAKGTFRYYLGLGILSLSILAYYMKLLPNYRLKEKFFSHFFKGIEVNTLKQTGDNYSEEEIPKITRQGAKEVLNWHNLKGHDILILSASADIWLEKWCSNNNYELICTRFEVKDGVYSGKLRGKNCFGLQKKVLLEEYMASQNYSYSYGYGDSSADRYFLELVNEPYLMILNEDNVKTNWLRSKE